MTLLLFLIFSISSKVPLIVNLLVLLLIIVPSCKITLFFIWIVFELILISPSLIKLISSTLISSAPSNIKSLFESTLVIFLPVSFSASQLYFESITLSFLTTKLSSSIGQMDVSFFKLLRKFLKLYIWLLM